MESKIYPTFHFIKQLTEEVHSQLRFQQYDYIIAPSRGGLVPGVMLSHLSGKKLIPIMWSTRDYAYQQTVNDIANDIHNGIKVVLIDDINDTGETFIGLTTALQYGPASAGKLILASLYQRYSTKYQSDCYASMIHSDAWIVFPWELE